MKSRSLLKEFSGVANEARVYVEERRWFSPSSKAKADSVCMKGKSRTY